MTKLKKVEHVFKSSIYLTLPKTTEEIELNFVKESLRILEELDFNGEVYISQSLIKKVESRLVNKKQIDQEFFEISKVIVFWVPKLMIETAGYINPLELEYWISSKKIIYGRPDNIYKTAYLDWFYENEYTFKPFNDLQKLLEVAVYIAKFTDVFSIANTLHDKYCYKKYDKPETCDCMHNSHSDEYKNWIAMAKDIMKTSLIPNNISIYDYLIKLTEYKQKEIIESLHKWL